MSLIFVHAEEIAHRRPAAGLPDRDGAAHSKKCLRALARAAEQFNAAWLEDGRSPVTTALDSYKLATRIASGDIAPAAPPNLRVAASRFLKAYKSAQRAFGKAVPR